MSLQNLDIVVAFSVVMALLSLLVTVLVQLVQKVVHLRGIGLVWGLERLFESVDATLGTKAKKLAVAVANHPLVATGDGHWGRAVAIRSDELLRVLDDLVINPKVDQSDLKNALVGLQSSIKADAEALLSTMNPNTAAQVRELVQHQIDAGRALRDRIATWFGSVMDRSTEWFVAKTRIITVVVAFVVTGALQVDALLLLKQLSSNADVRARLVQSADTVSRLGERVTSELDKSKTPDADVAAAKDAVQKLAADAKEIRGQLEVPALTIGNTDFPWDDGRASTYHLLGMLMTALFLSLGAPFWFNLLKGLSNLRPIVAGKVEEDEKPAQAGGTV